MLFCVVRFGFLGEPYQVTTFCHLAQNQIFFFAGSCLDKSRVDRPSVSETCYVRNGHNRKMASWARKTHLMVEEAYCSYSEPELFVSPFSLIWLWYDHLYLLCFVVCVFLVRL